MTLLVAVSVVLAVAAAAGAFFTFGPGLRTRGRRVDAAEAQVPEVEAWAQPEYPEVLVVNRSPVPVHDVRAFVALGRRRAKCVGWIRTLPPTGDKPSRVAINADSRERWIEWQGAERRGGRDVVVEVTFRDHTGQHWRRDRTGAFAAIDG
ncbi:hypothetical protein [Nocardioides daphniae]|uniref:hypothetical protein n=1 Tax=Nocardioides daphniae TaxID=402297 RepID=UPI001E5E2950|nr:hypothetical protein [Nocardioides daphniae]